MAILYHYCTTSAFHSIISKRSLWLSSLSHSNDYMEGKLIPQAIERLARSDNSSLVDMEKIRTSIEILEDFIDGLGFCLSERGDLLSQWRGYADDASGVAIGFQDTYLQWLSDTSTLDDKPGFTLKKVEYDLGHHDDLVKPTYNKLKQFIESGAFRMTGRLSLLDSRTDEEIEQEQKNIREITLKASITALTTFPHMFLLKAPAYAEEHEWRLISYFVGHESDSCAYRSIGNQIVPYRVFELRELERGPVAEIILGPKHRTPIQTVKGFLAESGYRDVRVVRSTATYR